MGAETQLKDIKPNRVNPRTIEEKRARALAADLEKFGDLSGIVNNVNPEWTVLVSGHQRMEVFRRGNGSLVITERYEQPEKDGTVARGFIYMDGQRYTYREVIWDRAKSDEATIKANGEYGQWDNAVLTNEWQFTVEQFQDFGIPALVFETNALNSEKQEAQEDNYTPPEVIETDIVPGDLFEIGPHRLLCGDSTKAEDVAKVINGENPYLMVTDPPYGVEYDPEWRNEAAEKGQLSYSATAVGKVQNDDRIDWTDSYSIAPCSVAYVWHSDLHAKEVQENVEDSGFEIRSQIIWAKPHFAISRGHYNWQHEPCWYAVKKGATAQWIGDNSQSTLWQIVHQKSETGHGTQKPVEAMARPIRNHRGDVYDPFLGSGTTMVAAHQLNRRCYGIEIDPKYCQVIIDRMRKLDQDIEIKRNGQPY